MKFMCYLQHWMFNFTQKEFHFPYEFSWIFLKNWRVIEMCFNRYSKICHSWILENDIEALIMIKKKNLDYSFHHLPFKFSTYIEELFLKFAIFVLFTTCGGYFCSSVCLFELKRKHLFLLFVRFCLLEIQRYQKLPSSHQSSRYKWKKKS